MATKGFIWIDEYDEELRDDIPGYRYKCKCCGTVKSEYAFNGKHENREVHEFCFDCRKRLKSHKLFKD